MPYVAQRKFRMGGLDFAAPGNGYDLPHIIPSDLVERTPHRSLANLLARRVIVQVEAMSIVVGDVTTSADSDPRVVNEGSGWWTVNGKRVHGRKGVKRALAELGG